MCNNKLNGKAWYNKRLQGMPRAAPVIDGSFEVGKLSSIEGYGARPWTVGRKAALPQWQAIFESKQMPEGKNNTPAEYLAEQDIEEEAKEQP